MKASRILHIILVVLGVAAVVLGAIERLPYPKVAMVAGGALAVVGVLMMGLSAMDKAAVGVFAILLLGHALYGCATVKGAAKSCEPTLSQETQVLTAASNVDEIVALALLDSLPFDFCVIQKVADKYISTHPAPTPPAGDAGSVTADLTQSAVVDAIRLRNLIDWRAERP